ncbi:hypothetical protein C1H46_003034 [Malus baccata]|uniref:Peptidase M16C associated domain-containing protein n=1 Tax=Malus baccata TaxID=106549 RepID=A0A540NLB1_MALBA|nr:hypothetical protein C1H46_003034 [Malus baccata]
MGTKDLSFVQLNQLIGRKTGGISVYPMTSSVRGKADPCSHIIVRGKAMAGRADDLFHLLIGRKTGGISVYPMTSSVRGKADPCSHIIVRGKAMAGRADDLFHLVNFVLQEVQFTDQQRFKQFVSQSKARMEVYHKLYLKRGGGHGIAAARMDAKLNTVGWISEQMGGVSYLEFLQALEEKVDQDWDGISSSLEEIRKSLLSRQGCIVNITAEGKNLTNSEKFMSKFLDLLPNSSPVATASWNAQLPSANEAIVIPTQVNYVGKAGNIYDTGYRLSGSAHVISKYISNTWLWDHVRVSVGAYGGFCDFDSHSEMDDETLSKSIIGTIGDVDSYQLPDAKGYSSLLRYLLGITEEERQVRRAEILSTSLKDFKEFANAIDVVKDKGVVVAVASPDDVDAAQKERNDFFQVKRAL